MPFSTCLVNLVKQRRVPIGPAPAKDAGTGARRAKMVLMVLELMPIFFEKRRSSQQYAQRLSGTIDELDGGTQE